MVAKVQVSMTELIGGSCRWLGLKVCSALSYVDDLAFY